MTMNIPQGASLLALGSDIVEVDRIRGLWERHGDAFLDKVFSEEERRYCLAMRNSAMHLAARFAAKEAVSKCFGTGMGEKLSWRSVSVFKGERGEPGVSLDARGEHLLKACGGKHVLLTLSHTGTLALAVAAIIGEK